MREPYKLKMAHGDVLSLQYSFRAIKWFEKQSGGYFFGDSGAGRIGAEYLATGLAAGLLYKNKNIKPDDIDSLIEKHLDAGGTLPDLVNGLIEALKAWGVLKGELDESEEKEAARADPSRPTKGAAPEEK